MRLMKCDSQETLGHDLQQCGTPDTCKGQSLIIIATRANGREPQSVRMPIASLWTGFQRCLSHEAMQPHSFTAM